MLDNLYLLPTPPLTPYSLRLTPYYLVLDDGLVGREGGGDPEHALLDLMQRLLVLLGTPG